MDFSGKIIMELDVSNLEPPEPFIRIMEKIPSIDNTKVLKVIHRREPFPLYRELKKIGFEYYTIKNDDKFIIYIYRK